MQYQALYRKYRPQRFDEVVGQDHVTTTLAREVVDDKIAHAYLFTGPRGTGKTTTARLLAKSLNCPNRKPDGEPCNDCPSCEGITEGSSLDVIELDAASHNKVEDVREIRVNVSTVAAAAGARRVYILDEAHMLSRAAGNALLKTLEEPPEHVVFVLATTEPYKLLDTIRSRTQRFDFHPVATETLIEYLGQISDREGFTYDHGALAAVTAHAGGSVRDAMSLLEQVAALGAGEVSTQGVERALGLADGESYKRLVGAIVANDPAAGLTLISDITRQGADLRRFVSDAIGYLRGIFLAQYAPNIEDVVDAPRETIDEWREMATTVSSPEVLRAIDELSQALLHIRDGREERLVVELSILKLTKPEVSPDLEAITARVARLERDIKSSPAPVHSAPAVPPQDLPADRPFEAQVSASSTPAATPSTQVTPQADVPRGPADEPPTAGETSPPEEIEPPSEPSEPAPSEAGPDELEPAPSAAVRSTEFDLADFNRIWPSVAASIRTDVGPRRHALLKEATPVGVQDGTVVFEVAAHMHFHLEQLKADQELADAISAGASAQLGGPVRVRYQSADAPVPVEEEPERVPDKGDLEEAKDEGPDPTSTVLEMLGGEIVTENSTE
ncbi:MAG: DNA polymerase III subunit gamma/tau [Acidimicrobiia bacterium]